MREQISDTLKIHNYSIISMFRLWSCGFSLFSYLDKKYIGLYLQCDRGRIYVLAMLTFRRKNEDRERERESEGGVVKDIFHAGKQKKFPVFDVSSHCLLVILIEVRLRDRA
jgi:hypothetical protein